MNLPPKLPSVVGEGPVADGFRMAFETINALRDYCASLPVKPSFGVDVKRTPTGTTLETTRGTGAVSEEGEARWA